jgi:hypothetical protein
MSGRSIFAGFITVLFAWTLGAGAGLAQQSASPPPAAAPADPAALTTARELITTMRATEQVKMMLPTIMQALRPAIAQGRPQVERDLDTIVPVLLDGMSNRIGELVDQMATVYVRNFSIDEMRELTAFYRSSIGQKLLEKLPTVMQESMTIGQAFGQRVAGEMQSRLIEELRKKGHDL